MDINKLPPGRNPPHEVNVLIEVPLRSDGMAWRPLVHVDDIAAAFVALLEAPRELVHDRAYNVGRSEENYLVRDIAELVAEVVPGSRLSMAAGAGLVDVAAGDGHRVVAEDVALGAPPAHHRRQVGAGHGAHGGTVGRAGEPA